MTSRNAESAPGSSGPTAVQSQQGGPTKAALLWSRILGIAGLVLMVVGVLDPMEGSFVILAGSGLVVLGAFLGKSRRRVLLLCAFILLAVGVGALVVMSALGGLGADTGRSMWWALVFLPYPVGWVMGLVGAVLRLVEAYRRPASAGQQTGPD